MNTSYSRDIVLTTLENYIKKIESMNPEQQKSYSKIYKSIKDSIDLINSLSDMNQAETSEYFRLLMGAISASIIIR